MGLGIRGFVLRAYRAVGLVWGCRVLGSEGSVISDPGEVFGIMGPSG